MQFRYFFNQFRNKIRNILVISLLANLIFFSGCASYNSCLTHDPCDPLEPLNRVTFGVNQVLDGLVIRPVAWTYKNAIPYAARYGAGNFLSNLMLVPTVINDMLQGDIRKALQDAVRFGINSTFGMAGVFDLAKYADLPHHYTEFGETLYRWGWENSSYLVIPVFGSSTIRDMLGRGPEYGFSSFISPIQILFGDGQLSTSVSVLGLVHYKAEYLDLKKMLLENGVDPYVSYRSAYLQHRQYRLSGGALTSQPEAEIIGADIGTPISDPNHPNLNGEPPA